MSLAPIATVLVGAVAVGTGIVLGIGPLFQKTSAIGSGVWSEAESAWAVQLQVSNPSFLAQRLQVNGPCQCEDDSTILSLAPFQAARKTVYIKLHRDSGGSSTQLTLYDFASKKSNYIPVYLKGY